MVDRVKGTFVSEKVSKVRWKPEDGLESHHFLTGSWDNEVNMHRNLTNYVVLPANFVALFIKLYFFLLQDANKVSLWACPVESIAEGDDPQMVCSKPVDGDVTELKVPK